VATIDGRNIFSGNEKLLVRFDGESEITLKMRAFCAGLAAQQIYSDHALSNFAIDVRAKLST
jgi:hypothetical protein